jgi:hypothetical protein
MWRVSPCRLVSDHGHPIYLRFDAGMANASSSIELLSAVASWWDATGTILVERILSRRIE